MIVARGGAIGPEHLPAPVVIDSERSDGGDIAGLVRRWAEHQFRDS